MGQLVCAFASSHNPSLMVPPERWEPIRQKLVSRRRADIGDPPQLAQETAAVNRQQYQRCLEAFATMRRIFADAKVNLLILVGDDQAENFHEENMPPFCVFVGEELWGYPFRLLQWYFGEPPGERMNVLANPESALRLLEGLYARGFDPAYARRMPDQQWGLPHAHIRVLHHVCPESDVPVIPIHVNSYHPPCPSPSRCYALGRALRDIIEKELGPDVRAAIYGSGGLSHDPYGPYGGIIDEEHDRWVLARFREGRAAALAALSSRELQEHLDVELRNWIVVAGAIQDARPVLLDYVPSYRTIVGMGFAAWVLS